MAQGTRTFSDLWYRVAEFRPRLSPHLNVRRQTYRHETWFVLGDPASSKYFRFNASAYRFLGLLDGQRTVHEAWEVCNAQLGDDAPTQTDCINLLAQLQLFGLLKNDLPIDPDRLRERIDKMREQRYAERVGGYVFFTIPLINPERLLAKYVEVGRLIFSGWGLAALLVLLATALSMVLPRWEELADAANNIIAPDNIIYLSLCLFGMKAIHEFAHGFSCKAYGGRVTEIGVFMMMILPLPYCDATASWSFPNKWQRIIVSSAGMMVELAIACVAAIIWARTEPGLLHTLCYNVMFIASVMTIVFNLNPLLRYDGYYILSDLLEIPNLALRSHELLKYLTRKYLFGLKGEQPPAIESRREAAWMILHAACAFPYRMLVVLGIVLFVAQQYFIIGFLIGVFGAIMWIIVPLLKGISFVVADPMLQIVRPRAVGVTFGAIALVVGFIGFVPLPSRVWATGVVEPAQMTTYRVPSAGFLANLWVQDGSNVQQGDPLLRLFNPEVETDYRKAQARLELERTRLSAATAGRPVDRRLAEPMYDDAVEQFNVVSDLRDNMMIRADFAGQVIAPELDVKQGAYFTQGKKLLAVATLDDLVIRAYVDDSDFAILIGEEAYNAYVSDTSADEAVSLNEHLMKARRLQAKIEGRSTKTYDVSVDRESPVATRGIRHTSLGHVVLGGRIALDPGKSDRNATINPQWELTLRIEKPSSDRPEEKSDRVDEASPGNLIALPGTRARVRFTLDPKPLAAQWWRKLRRAFARRFDL